MIKAVIFDMNGVIIDDERIHQESWRQFAKKLNLHISENEFKHNVFGRTEKDTFEFLLKKKITETELAKLSDERVDFAIAIFKPKLKMTEGLDILFQNIAAQSLTMAIATSSRQRYTDFILDGLNIRHYFKVIVTAQDILKGKPNPEIYLKAASKLQIPPVNCVVFEDTISGIKSAQAANMKVIAIATTHDKSELGIADKVIKSFNEIDVITTTRL